MQHASGDPTSVAMMIDADVIGPYPKDLLNKRLTA